MPVTIKPPHALTRPGAVFVLALTLVVVAFAACDSGDQTLLEVDPGAVTADPTFEMVQNIMDRSCVPCHASGEDGEDEEDKEDEGAGARLLAIVPADDDRDYSTCFGILDDINGVIRTGVENESMPPGAWPRLSEEEKLIITRWLVNGACAPCNECP